ncbi:MAG: RiPP maturation radical SAM C-methyltransferase [Thermoleophilia bacterium]
MSHLKGGGHLKVLLVVMPFAANERPALGVSLLKAHLLRDGVPCDVAYLNLAFAELIGRRSYERIVSGLPHRALPGEWVFAECLWGRHNGLPESYVDDLLRTRWRVSDEDVDLVNRAQGLARGFLRASVESITREDYDVVGFSSYAAQNLASLALARLVKEANPSVSIVFGGANWQGRPGLELHRRFGFVDFACSGEADVSFPLLVRKLAGDDAVHLDAIPGLIYRHGGASRANAEGKPIADLDSLPLPDYGDFYSARHQYPDVRSALPSLTAETSRGCWWATTGPCSFCGMDSRERVYRAKSPERVLAELRELTSRWPCAFIHLADTVVSPAFLDVVLPAVVADPLPARLFFEVRPNLTWEQVTAIAAARAHIQPGIESFSDHVLRLMHKGTRALENIRLLKWCRTLGVGVHWNLLHGLPGETRDDYDAMLQMLPSIRFLTAPTRETVSVDRYSPYFEAPREHGIARLSPLAPYRYLYPFPESVLADIAYSFEYECSPICALPDVAEEIQREVSQWRHESPLGDLRVMCDGEGAMTLLDRRPAAAQRTVELDDLETLLYRACDTIAELSALKARAAEAYPDRVDVDDQVDATLASLVERRLMVTVGERYLSLALSKTLPKTLPEMAL